LYELAATHVMVGFSLASTAALCRKSVANAPPATPANPGRDPLDCGLNDCTRYQREGRHDHPDPHGGYGPATTGFSRALKLIGDRLTAQFGDRVDIKYVWNIMDSAIARGHSVAVEHGLLTLGYQSSSYLTDRVPELGLVDLPFLFQSTAPGAGRDRRRAWSGAGMRDRRARRLPHPRLLREWLPPYLEPDTPDPYAGGLART